MTTGDLLSHHRVRRAERERADRATDWLRDAVGSWGFLAATALTVATLTAVAIGHDEDAGAVAVLGLLLSGVSTVCLVVVLMAASRAARTGHRRAVHDVESARRLAAAIAELRDEVDDLRGDVVRLSAGVHRASRTTGF